MNPISVSVDVGGRTLTLETGKYAKQAHGAVVVKMADSSVLCTATAAFTPARFDFLPLTCEYMDRSAAYGKIPGGFFKREGRSNEREILASRIIDRPIRPQFPKTWRFETQLIATALSFDPDCDTDVLAISGCAAAVHISDIPMKQAVAGVRLARVDGNFVVNPPISMHEKAELLIVVAGTADAVCMVEGGGREVSESVMMDALDVAHAEIKKI